MSPQAMTTTTVRPVAAPQGSKPAATAPRPVVPNPKPAGQPRPRKRRMPVLILLGVLIVINLGGLPYYLLSQAQRVRSPLHPWLKPTGYIGQSAGLTALALFLFMWLYPLRKKFRWLEFTGSIAKWLDVHIAAGLCIPLLASVHAAWRFTGLIGLGYASMMIVVLSGVIGKYLYARIPHSRSGLEMTLEEINAERRVLLKYMANTTGMPLEEIERILSPQPVGAGDSGVVGALVNFVRDDFDRWRAERRLSRGWQTARGTSRVDRKVVKLVHRMARREMSLSQQVRLLDATHQVFRYWHVAHRPVAISAFLAIVIHVAVAVAMRVTWLF